MLKTAKQIFTVSEAEYRDHENDYDGICLACGEWTCGGCEPDAQRYECEACGLRKVYGASEALMMGRVDIAEDKTE